MRKEMNVIIKANSGIHVIDDVRGFVEMNLRKPFDRLKCQLVNDDGFTVILQVKAREERLALIEEGIRKNYWNNCVILKSKSA